VRSIRLIVAIKEPAHGGPVDLERRVSRQVVHYTPQRGDMRRVQEVARVSFELDRRGSSGAGADLHDRRRDLPQARVGHSDDYSVDDQRV
jgi:hypothetical protein